MIKIKRIYEMPSKDDGFRVLVDRLWPRGVSKGKANIDLWLKDIAPSDVLRKWFGHKEGRWEEFEKKYRKELGDKKEPAEQLKTMDKKGVVTLLYAAKDETRNNAVILKDLLSTK
ncbi:MAG: DUF488 domain-containing protein [Candidatus Omnitrophica bacterium]|nr:DUF488 domain-containing protein [Candidatus Omnitrophota bacterium]